MTNQAKGLCCFCEQIRKDSIATMALLPVYQYFLNELIFVGGVNRSQALRLLHCEENKKLQITHSIFTQLYFTSIEALAS